MEKIKIPTSCEPYMYNTNDNLNKVEIGDILEIQFGVKSYGVKSEYIGKKLTFIVNNYFEHNWRRPTRRLALIPLELKDSFTKDDILFLDDADRFECLMIDLFPVNRIPYKGWKNKTITFKNVTRKEKIHKLLNND